MYWQALECGARLSVELPLETSGTEKPFVCEAVVNVPRELCSIKWQGVSFTPTRAARMAHNAAMNLREAARCRQRLA